MPSFGEMIESPAIVYIRPSQSEAWSKDGTDEKPVTWQGPRAGSVDKTLSIVTMTPDFGKCIPHVKSSCMTIGIALKKMRAIEEITRYAYSQDGGTANGNGFGKFTKGSRFFRFTDNIVLLAVVKKKTASRASKDPFFKEPTEMNALIPADESLESALIDFDQWAETRLGVGLPTNDIVHTPCGLRGTSMALPNSQWGTKPGQPAFAGGRGGVAHTKCNTQMKVENGLTSLAAPAVCPTNAFLGQFGGCSSMSSAGAVTPQLCTTRGGSSGFSMLATNLPSGIGSAPVPDAAQGTKRRYSATDLKTRVENVIVSFG